MDNNILDMNDTKSVEKNLVTLIEDEDVNLSGASTPGCAAASAISGVAASLAAISALFTVTSACTKSCK